MAAHPREKAMPRKLIKRYMPDENTLRNHRHLSWLGRHLQDPSLWRLSRKPVAKAFMVGIFCAFLPIPLQMLVAAIGAIIVGANLPVSVGLVWITNPLTMPPIFYCSYVVGTWIVDVQEHADFAWDYHSLMENLSAIWWPLLAGSLVCGVILSAISYLAINRFWIWHVRRSWKDRRQPPKK